MAQQNAAQQNTAQQKTPQQKHHNKFLKHERKFHAIPRHWLVQQVVEERDREKETKRSLDCILECGEGPCKHNKAPEVPLPMERSREKEPRRWTSLVLWQRQVRLIDSPATKNGKEEAEHVKPVSKTDEENAKAGHCRERAEV